MRDRTPSSGCQSGVSLVCVCVSAIVERLAPQHERAFCYLVEVAQFPQHTSLIALQPTRPWRVLAL